MPIPFNHTRVTDGLLRAIRYAGLISNDASVETIRNFTNDMTDAELDAAVAALAYGSRDSKITSQDDAYILVDSDALPAPREDHTNSLRLLRWREDIPTVADPLLPAHEMASIYWPTAVPAAERAFTLEMVLGPSTETQKDIGVDDTYYESRLFLGSFRNAGGGTNGYLRLVGGPKAGMSDISGGRLHVADDHLDISSYNWQRFWRSTSPNYSGNDNRIHVPVVPDVHLGGFMVPSGAHLPLMYVGDFDDTVGSHALLLGDYADGDFSVMLNRGSPATLYLGGYDPDYANRVLINGTKDLAVSERHVYNADYATLGVFGVSDIMAFFDPPVAEFHDLRTYYNSYTDGYNFKVISDIDRVAVLYRLMAVWANDSSTGYEKVFRVDSNGICRSGASFQNGGADLAEWFDADTDAHELGTVLVIGNDGKCTAADSDASSKIVGVISESPAVVMNADEFDAEDSVILTYKVAEHEHVDKLTLNGDHSSLTDWITVDGDGYEIDSLLYNEETETTVVQLTGVNAENKLYLKKNISVRGDMKKHVNRVLVGLCGRVDTNCITANGSIIPGDLIVSAPGGKAQKAGDTPAPGTILGKAIEALEQPGEEVVSGKIKILVTLQ